MKSLLPRFFRKSVFRVGYGMRGRIHKISIVAGGELSIVIRCGMDEPRARQLLQGSLVELFETREGIPPAPSIVTADEEAAALKRASAALKYMAEPSASADKPTAGQP